MILKKISKKNVLIIIFLIIAFFIAIFVFYQKTEKKFQEDADIVRLRHLKYYSDIIEEYKEKTGKYPLQDRTIVTNYQASFTEDQKNQIKTLPVYVEIANEWQEDEAKKYNDAIPFSHYNGNDKEFFYEIEKGLGRRVDEYYDPQKKPSGRPNFYVYVVNEDGDYYFAVHTYQEYPFGLYLAKNYYKIEVSNSTSNQQSILSNELFSREEYISESQKELKKSEFFSNLENEFLQESK